VTETQPASAREPSDHRLLATAAQYHFALAAVIDVVTGLALVVLGLQGTLLGVLFTELDAYLTGNALLVRGEAVAVVATVILPLVGVVLVVVGVAAGLSASGAWKFDSDRRRTAAGLAAAINPLALPIAVVAVALQYVSNL